MSIDDYVLPALSFPPAIDFGIAADFARKTTVP
jgi:hypothetical protein